MQTRDRTHLHRLVDGLPEAALPALERFLEQMGVNGDPVRRSLADLPEDDEPLTAEDEAALEEAYADVAAGRVIPHEEVRQRFLGGS